LGTFDRGPFGRRFFLQKWGVRLTADHLVADFFSSKVGGVRLTADDLVADFFSSKLGGVWRLNMFIDKENLMR
jgi:hypothetical protein